MSVSSILFIKLESDRRPIALGIETGAAVPRDCNSAMPWSAAAEVDATHVCLWRLYLYEQASVGLYQGVVKCRHVSPAEAASFASTEKRVHTPTVGGENEAVPGEGRVEQSLNGRPAGAHHPACRA